jgi:hypothetical protein
MGVQGLGPDLGIGGCPKARPHRRPSPVRPQANPSWTPIYPACPGIGGCPEVGGFQKLVVQKLVGVQGLGSWSPKARARCSGPAIDGCPGSVGNGESMPVGVQSRWVSRIGGGCPELMGAQEGASRGMQRRAAAGEREGWIQSGGIRERKESADKPGSVVGNHSSAIRVAAYLQRPTREPVRAAHCDPIRGPNRALPYLVLLQAGFAVPPSVTTGAVRSYRTISPLPSRGRSRALRRYAFCCTFRGLTSPRCYLAPCPGSPDFPPPLQARAAVAWPTPLFMIQKPRKSSGRNAALARRATR